MNVSSRMFSHPFGGQAVSSRRAVVQAPSTMWSMLWEVMNFVKVVAIFAVIMAAVIAFKIWLQYGSLTFDRAAPESAPAAVVTTQTGQ